MRFGKLDDDLLREGFKSPPNSMPSMAVASLMPPTKDGHVPQQSRIVRVASSRRWSGGSIARAWCGSSCRTRPDSAL